MSRRGTNRACCRRGECTADSIPVTLLYPRVMVAFGPLVVGLFFIGGGALIAMNHPVVGY